MEEIRRAIREKLVPEFSYDGHPRTAEIHVYGVGGGRKGLLASRRGGSSPAGETGRKRFGLDGVAGAEAAGERFRGPRPLPQGPRSARDEIIAAAERTRRRAALPPKRGSRGP